MFLHLRDQQAVLKVIAERRELARDGGGWL
jgi:hypothetical protein